MRTFNWPKSAIRWSVRSLRAGRHAHAIQLADQKAVVKAGADVLVQIVQRQPLDEEYLAILREKKPYWATVIGLGDPTEVCNPNPFFEQALPPEVIVKIRATTETASARAQLRSTIADCRGT